MSRSVLQIQAGQPIEINAGSDSIYAVSFAANGEYLVTGHSKAIRVWRVEDGKELATMEASDVSCLAVSKDGKWIAAGTEGQVLVWDAETRKQVCKFKKWATLTVYAVDFSPDSTQLVSGSADRTATIWDITNRKQVQTRSHENQVTAAKYGPRGDRVATVTLDGLVQVWDASNGHLLVSIQAKVYPYRNSAIVWLENDLLVLSDHKIKQFDSLTGSPVSEWPVPDSDKTSCIFLSQHGDFVAYSTSRSVSFWDTQTRTQLGLIEQPQDIISISLSPDDRSLAIQATPRIISVETLSHATTSKLTPSSPLHPTVEEDDIQIGDAALDAWKNDQLASAEALLTTAISESQNPSYHVLAARSLVRARLQQWDVALLDAEMAIKAQPSVMGYVAKSTAHVGMGEKYKGYRSCDIALWRFHSSDVTFLLLIKAIVVFMAGEHEDAIARIDDLIAVVDDNSTCYAVQAYMYFFLGNLRIESGDYDSAIQLFRQAQPKTPQQVTKRLFLISLISGWKFDNMDLMIRKGHCKALCAAGRTKDAVECFQQLAKEFGEETSSHGEHMEWALNLSEKLEGLGDVASGAQRYDDAISHYSTALSLSPSSPQGILVKRSKAYMATGSLQQALDDANQVIVLDPLSPWGYEVKRAALHKAGDYSLAIGVLETMLSKLADSPDLVVRQHCGQYISPSSTRGTIRKIVQRTIRRLPRVLINTTDGRLHDKVEQASAFESLPIFNELVSSMATCIDYVHIKREVCQFFRYAMLSHRWEENEPLFHEVMQIAVYDLDESPTHNKLQMFCKIARDAGFNWAWCDTCCINKSDHFVLQEALVAMFKWYRGSALMIVFLRGVPSGSQRGALVRSVWNTRVWTLQEYVASKVIRFYTEDWIPYLDLKLPNHKLCADVISEMEQTTGVPAQQLMALRPGLTSIREKLCLASTRQTTLVEDEAYALLGIFSVSGLPAIYGEGDASLGRLLAHILAGSGDVSILAWTGESGGFNSCLPAHNSVFNGPATSHLPAPIPDAEMERFISTSRSPSFGLDMALRLLNRLGELPAPWFAANRLKLPCIAFPLPPFSQSRRTRGHTYRADTVTFGMVEIKTRHDLSRMTSLYLVHPWLDTLLEREDKSNVVGEGDVPPPSPSTDDGDNEEVVSDNESDAEYHSPLHESAFSSFQAQPAQAVAPMDKETRARRLVARLRQPFGALLVTLAATGGRAVDYRRVAADSVIRVQIRDDVSLGDLVDKVCTLDVL